MSVEFDRDGGAERSEVPREWKSFQGGKVGEYTLDEAARSEFSEEEEEGWEVEYARAAVKESGGDLKRLIARLAEYDEAVAAQAAHLWQSAGKSLLAEEAQAALQTAPPKVAQGIHTYLDAWRENHAARAGDKP